MNSRECDLLLMTIADMKRDLEAKIDAIDENKNVKKKYDNLNTRYEEMEKKKDELQNQVDIFRQKEAEKEAALNKEEAALNVLNAKPANIGKNFEIEFEDDLRKNKIDYQVTKNEPECGDFITNHGTCRVMIDTKFLSKPGIKKDDVDKLARDACKNKVDAAILVYNVMPFGKEYNNMMDFSNLNTMHHADMAPTDYDPRMFFACTRETFIKTLCTVLAKYRISNACTEFDHKVVEGYSEIIKHLMNFFVPFFEQFTNDEDFKRFCKNIATSVQSLKQYCSNQVCSNEEHSIMQEKVVEALQIFPNRRGGGKGQTSQSMFGPYPDKRKYLDDGEQATKKFKVEDDTGAT